DRVEHLERIGIDNRDRVTQLSGYVDEAVFRAKDGAMRAQSFAEIDRAGDLAFREINDAAIGAGLADAGVAVDGHESALSVSRSDQFVARHALFINGGNLFA